MCKLNSPKFCIVSLLATLTAPRGSGHIRHSNRIGYCSPAAVAHFLFPQDVYLIATVCPACLFLSRHPRSPLSTSKPEILALILYNGVSFEENKVRGCTVESNDSMSRKFITSTHLKNERKSFILCEFCPLALNKIPVLTNLFT